MTKSVLPLASWNPGATKDAIASFVASVTNMNGPHYVPEAERIAVFDNDGTLWSEHPWYFQFYFLRDRIVHALEARPELNKNETVRAILDGDFADLARGGDRALLPLLAKADEGRSTEEYAVIVKAWINAAKHPNPPGGGQRLYKQMVFQPMLELLDYLRAHGFKTFIVSGGGMEFVRPWAEEVYGIPPEQVVGSHIGTHYYPNPTVPDDSEVLPEQTWPNVAAGEPVLKRSSDYNFVDDKAGKPVGIHRFIGRRPIAAIGNSTGDQRMLEWVTYGEGLRFGLIVKHDDGAREFDYSADPDNPCGHLYQTTEDQAAQQGWIVASMRNDWAQVYPDV